MDTTQEIETYTRKRTRLVQEAIDTGEVSMNITVGGNSTSWQVYSHGEDGSSLVDGGYALHYRTGLIAAEDALIAYHARVTPPQPSQAETVKVGDHVELTGFGWTSCSPMIHEVYEVTNIVDTGDGGATRVEFWSVDQTWFADIPAKDRKPGSWDAVVTDEPLRLRSTDIAVGDHVELTGPYWLKHVAANSPKHGEVYMVTHVTEPWDPEDGARPIMFHAHNGSAWNGSVPMRDIEPVGEYEVVKTDLPLTYGED